MSRLSGRIISRSITVKCLAVPGRIQIPVLFQTANPSTRVFRSGLHWGMSRKARKKKRKKSSSGAGRKLRRETHYTSGELFLAALGLGVLVLVFGMLISHFL